MRIISDFHDFYDPIQKYGVDPKVIFQRKTDVKEITIQTDLYNRKYSGLNVFRDMGTYAVGFAGEVFPVVHFLGDQYNYKPVYSEHYCYSIDDIDVALKDRFTKKQYEMYMNGEPFRYDGYWGNGWYRNSNRQYVVDWLKQDFGNIYGFIFEKYDAPTFLLKFCGGYSGSRKFQLIINPVLKNCDFYRIYDPNTAYQKLFAYLQSVTPDIPEISDEMLAHTHGFNKFSFRQQSSRKKRKKTKKGA
jgi:hypothetical protein